MAIYLISSKPTFKRVSAPLLLCAVVSVSAMGVAHAAQPGHGRVTSLAGAPLSVAVPLNGLTADDLKVLKVAIADPASWAQAGLSLPAPVESLSVSIEPGLDVNSRTLVLRSTQTVNRPVVDVLMRLTTAVGTTAIQSSYLVLTSDTASNDSGSLQVARGDTLYAIALSRAVSGADIYQVMWAIYEANKNAFMSENMNWLRAGATLQIPDAATIRRVDPKYAREMFARHDSAFRGRRAGAATQPNAQVAAAAPSNSGQVTAALQTPTPVATRDQVRLASRSPADQQADERVASANALNEMQSRVDVLQKNVEDLQNALQKSQNALSLASGGGGGGAQGSAAAAVGATGASGTTGATGATGATGPSGSSAASPALAALGTTGKSDSSGGTGKSEAPNTEVVASNEVKNAFSQLKQYASDHVLGFVLVISALLALLFALLLRRAGRQEHPATQDDTPHQSSVLAADFNQKLQSIDLNLDGKQPADPRQLDAPKTGA